MCSSSPGAFWRLGALWRLRKARRRGPVGPPGVTGSVWEWVYDLHHPDWYANGGLNCRDCANLSGDGARVMRGGSFNYNAADLRAAGSFPGTAGAHWHGGLLCD